MTVPISVSPVAVGAKAPHATRELSVDGQGKAAKSKRARPAVASSSGRSARPSHARAATATAEGGAAPRAAATRGGADLVRAVGARRPRALLLPKHGVLQALGQPELAHALGGNPDRFAGLGIAPHPSLAIGEDELAEARHDEAVLGLLVG